MKPIYLIAGEPSGDMLGGALMAALKRRGSDAFIGVSGPEMQAQGLESLFPMSELSHMGLLEVIPQLPNIWARLNQVVADIAHQEPAVVVTIDCQDFSYQVAKRVRALGIPVVHYVAPTVWAWRPGRAKKIAKVYDHLLTLFDFEPAYFKPHGLAATFVGHPLVETPWPKVTAGFYKKYQLKAKKPIICLLPGSRRGEIKRLSPVMAEVRAWLTQHYPDAQIILPAAPAVKDQVLAYFPGVCLIEPEDKHLAFQASSMAVAASGTVVLELALAQVPTIVAYRVSAITAWLGQWLIKTPYVSLPNILLNQPVLPELLQDQCTPQAITSVLKQWLEHPTQCQNVREQLTIVRAHLEPPGNQRPSDMAAEAVLNLVK